MKSKAAVVQFLAETSANAAVEGTKTTYRYVNFNYVKFWFTKYFKEFELE